ncbi:hypothetical protein GOPIP_084_00170 [Gordonia polyisoprenivorans NBRC 16320 = JCM 10675]|nr:hypothetical protein GOPIP_084_00170 [Gordonia polyisoprenivorans NBRC 16320 = JCM 10675]
MRDIACLMMATLDVTHITPLGVMCSPRAVRTGIDIVEIGRPLQQKLIVPLRGGRRYPQ